MRLPGRQLHVLDKTQHPRCLNPESVPSAIQPYFGRLVSVHVVLAAMGSSRGVRDWQESLQGVR